MMKKNEMHNAGFKNVIIKNSSERAGWFKKAEDIVYVSINGTTEFGTDELFSPDSVVVIYRYSE